MSQALLGSAVARYLAAQLIEFGAEISGARLQELAAGGSASAEESDAISQLMLALFADYINRGGVNYDLIAEVTGGVRSAVDAVPAMVQLCGRLVGRVE